MTCLKQICKLSIFGAGGHGRVVADSAARAGLRCLEFIDDHPVASKMQGWSVVATNAVEAEVWRGIPFIVAIGSNAARARVFERLKSLGALPVSVIDPSSVVSAHATIGEGAFIAPGAIINTGTRIGANCIINTGASVDHDCVVGDHSQISPQACLAGTVCLGEEVMVGLGALIVPGRRIGARSVIGAGAVVTRDLPDGVIA